LAIITRDTKGVSTRETAKAIAGGLDHHLVTGPQSLTEALNSGPRHIDAAEMSDHTILPNRHLTKCAMNVDPDYSSHYLPPIDGL
jgi:hypothetical protein